MKYLAAAAIFAVSSLPALGQVYKVPDRRDVVTIPSADPGARSDYRNAFVQVNLVSTRTSDNALMVDPLMKNAWGLTIRPPGKGGHWWVTNAGTGTTTTYVGDAPGVKFGQDELKVVHIPVGKLHEKNETFSQPTGQVYAGHAKGEFIADGKDKDGKPVKDHSKFIFVTLDGTIHGWTNGQEKSVCLLDRGLESAMYTGCAITVKEKGNRLYVCEFNTRKIEVYDGQMKPVKVEGNWVDPKVDENFAIYNMVWHEGVLYAAWARYSNEPGDADVFPGWGFVSAFDEEGRLLKSFQHSMLLNAPWGLVVAPKHFGPFSGSLLVGNFGDGRVLAFDRESGKFQDVLRDQAGKAIELDGLWDLKFGNGETLGYLDHLYFAAGPDLEEEGLFGKLVPLFP